MKLRKPPILEFVIVFVCATIAAQAQQSNIVVTITSPQESNTVTRVEQFSPSTNQTNITTKTKFYQNGRLIQDKIERKGAVDITAIRMYHEGHLVMFQTWDSKSKTTQRTFLRDDTAVATEVFTDSAATPTLIFLNGRDEEIVAALRRDDSGELKLFNKSELAEIQRGAKTGAEFIRSLSDEKEVKKQSK